LDDEFYKDINDFEERFKDGIPSLKKCKSLVVKGDVNFGRNVEIKGNVKIAEEMNLENITLKNEEI